MLNPIWDSYEVVIERQTDKSPRKNISCCVYLLVLSFTVILYTFIYLYIYKLLISIIIIIIIIIESEHKSTSDVSQHATNRSFSVTNPCICMYSHQKKKKKNTYMPSYTSRYISRVELEKNFDLIADRQQILCFSVDIYI